MRLDRTVQRIWTRACTFRARDTSTVLPTQNRPGQTRRQRIWGACLEGWLGCSGGLPLSFVSPCFSRCFPGCLAYPWEMGVDTCMVLVCGCLEHSRRGGIEEFMYTGVMYTRIDVGRKPNYLGKVLKVGTPSVDALRIVRRRYGHTGTKSLVARTKAGRIKGTGSRLRRVRLEHAFFLQNRLLPELAQRSRLASSEQRA